MNIYRILALILLGIAAVITGANYAQRIHLQGYAEGVADERTDTYKYCKVMNFHCNWLEARAEGVQPEGEGLLSDPPSSEL